jgi:hypothetical protein
MQKPKPVHIPLVGSPFFVESLPHSFPVALDVRLFPFEARGLEFSILDIKFMEIVFDQKQAKAQRD